jgi:hypothetical protein
MALAVSAAMRIASPAAAGVAPVTLTASVNGANLAHATEADPVHITPGKPIIVGLKVHNGSELPVPVGSVDLNGRVAGLTFYSFDTSVSFEVPPGQYKSLSYVLNTTGLKGQATGLVPSSLDVYQPSGQLIASEPFVSDVNGSLISVYGLFGLGIFALTVLALVEALLALANGRLPMNRWRRGIRFMVPGLGVGGILVFTLSAFGKWLPSNGHWFSILAIFAAAGFVIGYLTPTPLEPENEEYEDEQQQIDGSETNTPSVSEIQA